MDHNLTIVKFNLPFPKYKNVLYKVYPHKRNEIDQSEADNDSSALWFMYHNMFANEVLCAIFELNSVISWAKVDKQLLNPVLHSTPSVSCTRCGEFDQTSRFCDSQKHV